jgi:hypothetical protein
MYQMKNAGKNALLVEEVPSPDARTMAKTPVGSCDGARNLQEDA